MEELFSAILALIIVLIGFSLIVSPLLGKPDCFLILRPVGQRGGNIVSGLTRGIARLFNRGGSSLFRWANSRSILMRVLLFYPVATALVIAGGIFSIIAEIVFGRRRR
ncbi:MAG: hypothetical protein PHH17_00570 [Candidatus Pacebacteria bacterium]|jgi:hypothetical protein|nr:hypothetical protein [Candidatus Paceibacterota bacterium]MDD3072193.1 hypothetical protein [Candidatus Paceibacterota bacterium]MDD3728743.1 hypothetical protein [Candidatus Paceibacterota bacterium]MDD4201399.1 hypothetical protein [Candidatus Paceibacterota bacterium]MDD4466838.1 hypothetical protein [Candidatus Paceibacterota bacterium]